MKPWFDRGTLKVLAFYTIVLTIAICSAGLILTIWDIIPNEELRDNILLTVVVIATAVLLVCLTNWAFLTADEDAEKGDVEDSALGRALQKAKSGRSVEEDAN